MSPQRPTLLVSRRPRGSEAQWRTARSWFGSTPRLGSAMWPVGPNSEPLHFAAQIDLAELAAVAGPTGLPNHGSFAFFIGGNGAVIHVPDDGSGTRSLPPENTPPLTQSGGNPDCPLDPDGRPLYPYWPVRLSALDIGPPPEMTGEEEDDDALEAYRADQIVAVDRIVPRREFNLSPAIAFAGPPIPDWWQNAIKFARDLADAAENGQGALRMWRTKLELAQAGGDTTALAQAQLTVERLEGELAKRHVENPGFRPLVAEVAAWTQGREPFAIMPPHELARFEAFWSRNTEFPNLSGHYGRVEIAQSLKPKMIEALPAVDTREFAALPSGVQALVRAHRAPRTMWWHSAILYAQRLSEARMKGASAALKRIDEATEADRRHLARLKPSGPLAAIWRMAGSASKDSDTGPVETRLASNVARRQRLVDALPRFEAFAAEMTAWVAGRDPWSPMSGNERDRLADAVRRGSDEFQGITGYLVPSSIEALETRTITTMLVGSERAYQALPEALRDRVNLHHLLPPGVWHQMFGWGVEIQGDSSAMREEGYILLLQLTYDDLMQWSFGDNGCYQFWISEADLASRNWAGVRMTFECH